MASKRKIQMSLIIPKGYCPYQLKNEAQNVNRVYGVLSESRLVAVHLMSDEARAKNQV